MQLFFVYLRFQRTEGVTNSFLDLIEWNYGTGKNKLRVYSMTAAHWRTIARKRIPHLDLPTAL